MTEVTQVEKPTDAQVFEAMGWSQRYDALNLPYWACGEGISYTVLPPVMSRPSSSEAWVAVPVMLAFVHEQGATFRYNFVFRICGKTGGELRWPDVLYALSPRAMPETFGEAIVAEMADLRAISEEGRKA